MSEVASNGHARFEDLRSDVAEHYTRLTHLEVHGAQVETRLIAVERSLDRLTDAIEKMREEESPRSQRERGTLLVQWLTIAAMVASMILPSLHR
jgi:septal ring factor EnvC (AmiA/AmiB activator)